VSKTGSKDGEQQDFGAHTSFCAARGSQFWTRLSDSLIHPVLKELPAAELNATGSVKKSPC
jgi:hypothetical protein